MKIKTIDFFDIHTHCIPCMDDGAQDIEESLAMLEQSKEQGVKYVVASSHCTARSDEMISDFVERREKRFCALNEKISEEPEKYPVLIKGAEVYLDNDLSVHSDIKKLCIGTSDFMLMEFPRLNIKKDTLFDWMYKLSINKIHPILAHVERYEESMEIIENLAEFGTVFQVNSSGFLSFSERRRLKKIIESGVPIIVSSDMHNTESRKSTMLEAYKYAVKMFGQQEAEEMFFENAYSLFEKDVKKA